MRRTLPVVLLAAAIATGCAAKQPTTELVDARVAYQRATQGTAARVNPAGLYDAKRALDAAEKAQNDDPGSGAARDVAYVALRKAQLAEANARTVVTQTQEQAAIAALQETRAKALASTKERLGDDAKMPMSEQQARARAEVRAKQAMESLGAIASVKQGPRGATVITLPGGVLFETGKAELLPTARERLNQVARALKQSDGRKVDVIGYTDNVGSDDKNRDLSRRRAETVKAYLVTQQVPADLLTAKGQGKENPIANNANPEGRAMNRRVELVVEGATPNE